MSDLEPERPPLRIGDADRERVAEALREAAAQGRITLEELDQRLEQTWAARTYPELEPITADLPDHAPGSPDSTLPATRPGGRVVPGDRFQRAATFMGALDRSGHWVVPERFEIRVVMGGGKLDLRAASFAAPEVVLHVNAVMGGVEIIVDQFTRVIMEGSGVMGSFTTAPGNTKPELTDASPVVRVQGTAFWGSVAVYRKRLKSDRPR
jgi:hypothetical protein